MNYEIGQWVRHDNEDWFVVQDFGTAYILVRSGDDDILETIKEQAKIVNIADHVIDPYQIQIGDLTQQVSPFHIRPYIA